MTIKPLPEGEEQNEPMEEPNWDALRLPEDDDGTARYGRTTFREQLRNTLEYCLDLVTAYGRVSWSEGHRRTLESRIRRDIKELELRRDLHL